jgi:hypothetical protein
LASTLIILASFRISPLFSPLFTEEKFSFKTNEDLFL